MLPIFETYEGIFFLVFRLAKSLVRYMEWLMTLVDVPLQNIDKQLKCGNLSNHRNYCVRIFQE